ncbi:MAG TPA: glutamine--fructose-6-phosphate aminotransferase, partial [Caldithrix sp.]|nr:glutamine--fructose-6-phosphate aminotransferase [Caldithrix sp.]
MCGIVGYIGERRARPILMNGLKRLEYRGYDSAGIAICNNGKISITKQVGKITALESELDDSTSEGTLGIAHTRWATHGEPTQSNAHPHTDGSKNIVLVH